MRPAISMFCAVTLLVIAAPAPHAATPISACGTTITKSGSYVVTKNLIAKKGATKACIVINSNYVTVDLGGWAIDCGCSPLTIGCPAGVDVPASALQIFTGIVVRDGAITHCGEGLEASGSVGVLIDGVSAKSNFDRGIEVGASGGNLVIRSLANDNGAFGVFLGCPSAAIDNTAVGNLGTNLEIAQLGCDAFNNLAP